MEQKNSKSQKSSASEEKQGFFQNLIASLFGSSSPEAELKRRLKNIAKDFSLEVLAKIPVEQKMSLAVDNGEVETLTEGYVDRAAQKIEALITAE